MADFKTRIKQKNDSTTNWNTANATGFKPLKGEIIVYNDVNRIKIGDGSNTVSNVPFLDANCVHLTGTETIDGYKTFKKYVTIEGGGVEGANIMLGAPDLNNTDKAGEIGWHDGEGNDGVVYIPQGQGETLARCYDVPTKFSPFAVGTNLSGKTLYFNTTITYDDMYFAAVKTIATSSGGYTLKIGGPPNIVLEKNGSTIVTFYSYNDKRWNFDSYTLPSDFGTVQTFNDAHGTAKDSIFYTLGIQPVLEYTPIDVEDVYLKTKTIPSVINDFSISSAKSALSAAKGAELYYNKAPNDHASSATIYGVGTTSNYGHVKIYAGDINGQTFSDGVAASTYHAHSNYVTTDTEQTINIQKNFTKNITFIGQSANTYLFDCYANDGQSDTIVGVYLNTIDSSDGKSKGELKLGDGSAECAISLKNSYGTSGQVLTSQGEGKTPIWRTFTASAPSNMVTTNTIQTISNNKTYNAVQRFTAAVQIDNGGDGISFFNSASSFAVDLTIDESVDAPEEGATIHLPIVGRQSAANLYLIGAASHGTRGKVLTSAATGNAATWSTLPEFAMNIALPISYRISTNSNGYYSSVSYGTASTVNCLMTRNLADHTLLNRHISYCIHLSTTITAGKWVRFDVPSISYNNTTYYPYIKLITASAIRSNTSTTPPSLVTYTSNNQSSGSMAYIGCCSQQISGLDVRIDCIVS